MDEHGDRAHLNRESFPLQDPLFQPMHTERSILRSDNAVIDRLLTRALELKPAYGELYEKLHSQMSRSRTLEQAV